MGYERIWSPGHCPTGMDSVWPTLQNKSSAEIRRLATEGIQCVFLASERNPFVRTRGSPKLAADKQHGSTKRGIGPRKFFVEGFWRSIFIFRVFAFRDLVFPRRALGWY